MKRTGTESFILLEVLLAVAILASALVALNGAIGQCIRSARSIDSYALSQTLFDRIIFELDEQQQWAPGILEGEFEGLPGYFWTQEIIQSDIPEEEGLFYRRITISWSDEQSSQTSETVESYLYLNPQQMQELGLEL